MFKKNEKKLEKAIHVLNKKGFSIKDKCNYKYSNIPFISLWGDFLIVIDVEKKYSEIIKHIEKCEIEFKLYEKRNHKN